MKNGCKKYTFGELGRVFNGNSISEAKKKAYFQGQEEGTPYIGTKDISFRHEINYESGVKIPIGKQEGFKLAPSNCVLVCAEGGSAGKKIAHTDRDVYFGNKLFAICPMSIANSRYVFYYCLSDAFKEQFKESIAGLIGGVSLNKFKNFCIMLPDIPEQRRIVAVLDKAFNNINTAKIDAEKNLQNVRELFKNSLNSIFTKVEKESKSVHLSAVLSEQPRNGWSPPSKYHARTGNPVLTLSAVTGFEYDGSRIKFSIAPTREDAHYWLKNNELLMTRSNTQELVGHVAIYNNTPAKAICCDLIMKMTVNPSKALTRFVYYYLRSQKVRCYITSRSHGASSTMKKIGKQVVQNIPVFLPSIDQQKSIVTTLDLLSVEAKELERNYLEKISALDKLEKSILHKAFNGVTAGEAHERS